MVARKEQIREFLKACRARVEPSDVGLFAPSRRRSPGLRREDVAVLAGVSVTWYTWLEQGRDINISAPVLERVCESLQLSCAERDYLFSLVHGRPAPRLTEQDDELDDTLSRAIQYLPMPALIMTMRWDVVAWNRLVARIFRDYGQIEPADRNLLRIILTDARYQRDEVAFDALARRLLAKFRVDYSQCGGDSAFEELIAELADSVPGFDELWKDTEIRDRMQGRCTISHEELGRMSFEQSSYVPEGSACLRLLMYVPYDAETAAKVASLTDSVRVERSAQAKFRQVG